MAGRGRPRTFDRTVALGRAMEVFWQHGYEGASMAELTTAMGIASPSLYAAFGSKEALFREAVAHYNATEGAAPLAALDGGDTARAGIEAMLRHNARTHVDPSRPLGCMVVLAATAGPAGNDEVRRFLAGCRNDDIAGLRTRVERGVVEGDVPPTVDSAMVARFFGAVQQGMSVQARDGASRETLDDIVTCAMAAWDRLVNLPTGSGGTRARPAPAKAAVPG
ncbi:TetR/AcrR family transcriptional regulator [Micromonospora sp. NBC_01699]|uniref:TetR/AcrR family transcriptional regulator n=1 Tax=Micromonospora sp. NBC_01699 TaxID=2975984 RepID=UPI002E2E2AE5|nr:TetR/AcrR family transcriptional regulator [Micromonospora sp. NBC_01699]